MLRNNESDDQVISDFEKRFVGYISSLLHYNSINFDKKIRTQNERFSLVLDQVEYMNVPNETSSEQLDYVFNELEDQISDPYLYDAFKCLSVREREVLDLSVGKLLRDTEIAQRLGVSQQSVSKSRKNALDKLRKSILGRGE